MTLGTVVVTGATSFIGCHLAPAFAAAGYRVIGALNTPVEMMDTLHADRWRHANPAVSRWCPLDMTDASAVAYLIAVERPLIWIQLAGIGKAFASSAYDLAEATRVDLLSLDAIYRGIASVGGRFLAAGSSMEYGNANSPHREEYVCWPETPYGLAKLATTLRARQLAARYGVPTRVARLYTLFGEFDSETRLVARLVERLRAREQIGIAPGAFRDVCDVADIVRGYLAMAADCNRDSVFDVFNLCRGVPIELKEIALLVAKECEADPALIMEDAAMVRAAEPALIFGASDKALDLLGWEPGPIAQSLSRMIRGSASQSTQNDAEREAHK